MSVKLDLSTRARVENLAEARQRTAHWVMREAITQYVDREEKREAFRQDTIKAWEEYRSTGLHVTADEADTWLAQLEQGNDIEPPELRNAEISTPPSAANA
ncbi:MAG: ribbon-helix-helix protein, CopG family [Burkholderiales bacterium]|nr:ribbon-helix-helix protein, CopG family [Burkholderiales bacterium]